ncbi:hypothetical protein B0H14DRAFT_2608869 [Mycena olivaceomarginata]|nr:hypothetical protein B0H14DRAFT_2608869 [Mycena olivaceomarginata]
MRWKVLTAGEKQQLIAQYEGVVGRGGVEAKSGRTRKTQSRKAAKGLIVEDDNEEEPLACKRATKRKRSARNEGAGEEANDDAPARTTATKPKCHTKPPARNEEIGDQCAPNHTQTTQLSPKYNPVLPK